MIEGQGQQQPATQDDDDDWYSSTLRRHSLKDIESAFARALKELTGKALRMHIMHLDLHPEWAGPLTLSDNAELVLRITPPPWRPPSDDQDKPTT